MSNKYFAGNKGRYIFCDICGQPCYAHEAIRLEANTGRPGLIVCPRDADGADPGLIPFAVPAEKGVPWTRINHTDVANGAAVLDLETTTGLGT